MNIHLLQDKCVLTGKVVCKVFASNGLCRRFISASKRKLVENSSSFGRCHLMVQL
jgi:hypothetical protein